MWHAHKECRKRWNVPTDLRGQQPESTNFYEEVLMREDKKWKFDKGGPKEADDGVPSLSRMGEKDDGHE